MEKKIANMIRVALCIMIGVTVAMFVFWLPRGALMVSMVSRPLPFIDYDCMKPVIYVFASLVTIPIFTVFIMAFQFPSAFLSNSIFTKKTANLIKRISVIIFSDCIFFASGLVLFIVFGDYFISPILMFVAFIGILISLALYILSVYVERAAALKEEVDHTL